MSKPSPISERLQRGEHHRRQRKRVGAPLPLPSLRVLRLGHPRRARRARGGRGRRQGRPSHPLPRRRQRLPLPHHPLGGSQVARRRGSLRGGELPGDRRGQRGSPEEGQRSGHRPLSGIRRGGGGERGGGELAGPGRTGGGSGGVGVCCGVFGCLHLQGVSDNNVISSSILRALLYVNISLIGTRLHLGLPPIFERVTKI